VSRVTELTITSALALLALSATASTAAALQNRSEPMSEAPSGFEGAKVKCEDGERVISGGHTGSPGDYALVNKAVKGKAWVVKGEFALPATAFAYCSRRLEPETAKKTKEFDGGVRANATARCRRGAAAAGGWAFKPRAGNSPVFTSRPSLFLWKVGAFSGTSSGSITSFAYCLREEFEVHQNTSVLPAGNSTVTTATCDAGSQLMGGGFETLPEPDFDNKTGPDPFIYTQGRDDPLVWAAGARNYSAAAGSLEAFAICLP
jgi:hypothetical protein